MTAAAAVPMTHAPRMRTVARAAFAATITLTLLGWTFLALSLNDPVPSAWGFRGFSGTFALAFGWIGSLLATRRSSNPIGWAFLGAGLLSGSLVAAAEYASFTLFGPRQGLPGGVFCAWLNEWLWVLLVTLATTPVFLYFPDGRLLSRRWRAVLWIGLASAVVASAILATVPGPMQTFGITNPFGLGETASERASVGSRSVPAAAETATMIWAFTIMASAGSAVLRFRRSRGVERQQLKWLAAASVIVAMALGVSFANADRWAEILLIIALTTVPLSIGIAILRYRLYEIDTIINRAIVYGALTAILAGLYSASIGLFQRLFTTVTGERSDAAIVVTTLILASAFTPVKSWLQAATDRRFKAPADARKRLEGFRESLRIVSEAVDRTALRRRFLEEIIGAFRCRGATLVLTRGSQTHEDHVGEPGAAVVRCDVADDGVVMGRLELGPRADGSEYTAADVVELEKTAAVVARAYVLAERLALARTPGG